MEKPQLKNFTGNRKEKSRKYNIALNNWRKSQKDSSGKRTSYVDILGFKWKKEGDKYVQYRGNGTKTGKTRPYDINANKKNTRRGKRPDNNKKEGLKVNNNKSGSGLSNIPAEEGSNKKFNPNFKKKTVIKKEENKGTFGDAIKKGEQFKNEGGASTPKYKKVTQEELDAKLAENKKSNEKPKVTEKKQPKLIKKKKGKGFVSTKSPRGKQLLKIEERKRKLREKRFGKK